MILSTGWQWFKSRCLPVTKHDLQEMEKRIMATQQDLDNAIAALPAAIETAIETALAPIIAAIQAKAGAVDFTPEITSLNAIPAAVASAVSTAVTPAQ